MSLRGESSLWGDGFAEDDWSAMAGIRSWDACEPDQYVRFYPALAGRSGNVPAPLRVHLVQAIADRARRSTARPEGREGAPAASRSPLAVSMAISLWDRVCRLARPAPEPADSAVDQAALALLEAVLAAVRTDTVGDVGFRQAATFAFLSGIHPAYLWPAAALAQERHAAAGWLGIVGGGRPALMPADVADYMLDVITCRDGRPIAVRDGEMADLVRAARVDLGDLWRVADGRRAGRGLVLRQRRRRRKAQAIGGLAASTAWIDGATWKANRL